MQIGVIRVAAALCCLPLLTIAAPGRSVQTVRMWDLVRSAQWDLTVRNVERRSDPLAAPDGTLVRPSGRFALFVVDLTNRTDRPLAPRPDDFALATAAGVPAVNLGDTPAARAHADATDRVPFGDPVPRGATITTLVLIDIDAHAGGLTLHFLPARQPIQIDECKCNLPSPVRTVSGG